MKPSIRPDFTIDAFGLICPMPIFRTCQKINELRVGQILELIADDEGVKEDIPAWCKSSGNEFLGIVEENGEYRLYIRKLKEDEGCGKKECR